MDLRQIRYFVAVYEEGGFTQAARRERCTQPGLSVHVQRLEDEVGQRLFERTTRGTTPTLAGRHLYECSTGILQALAATKQRMLALAGDISGAVSVGIVPIVGKSVLPNVLNRYTQAHRNVDIRIAEGYSGTMRDWILAGDLDFAVLTEPPPHPALDFEPFCRAPLVLVGAPLAASGNARAGRPPDFDDLQLVLPSTKRSFRHTVDRHVSFFKSVNVSRVLEIDGHVSALEFVRQSNWFTILPSIAVAEDIEAGRLACWPLPGFSLAIDFVVGKRKEQSLSPAAAKLLEMLKNEVQRLLADHPPEATSGAATHQNSNIMKSLFAAPQSGHVQLSGTSAHRVPGAMPSSGAPNSSS